MKQKIVLKVQLTCEKCRRKAMKVAVAASGVISVAVPGNEKDELVVIGMGVDAACLTEKLRKKVGYASIVSVEEVKEQKKKEDKKDKEKKKEGGKDKVDPTAIQIPYYYPSWPSCHAIPVQDEYPCAVQHLIIIFALTNKMICVIS
ncbi:hypothetical protein Ancab_024879 [Ancistrocladus abbreviatus]